MLGSKKAALEIGGEILQCDAECGLDAMLILLPLLLFSGVSRPN